MPRKKAINIRLHIINTISYTPSLSPLSLKEAKRKRKEKSHSTSNRSSDPTLWTGIRSRRRKWKQEKHTCPKGLLDGQSIDWYNNSIEIAKVGNMQHLTWYKVLNNIACYIFVEKKFKVNDACLES